MAAVFELQEWQNKQACHANKSSSQIQCHAKKNKQKKTLCQKTLKDEALKMQQYIQTSLKGVSTKWFLCRGKGIEQIGWWCRRRQTEAYVRKGRHTERGGGNLTLSPQVSRFSQTRWRLWGVQEDQTGRRSQGGGEKRRNKKKMWVLHDNHFFYHFQWKIIFKNERTWRILERRREPPPKNRKRNGSFDFHWNQQRVVREREENK